MVELSFPDLPQELTLDAAQLAQQRRRDEVRKRVRATMPPLPELRFEMAYLRSILPLLRSGDQDQSASTAISTGRAVYFDWRNVAWITVKEQVISPFFQGMFWGLLAILGGGFATSARSVLGMAPHKDQTPGDVRARTSAGWDAHVKSKKGAIETTVAGVV